MTHDHVPATSRHIGELCFGGDWACAHGDLETLRIIAQQLAAYTPEPLHCRLLDVADACDSDPDRAVPLWMRVKRTVLAET